MTINDEYTNEQCLKIRQLADKLQIYEREGKEHALFMALSDIEKAARNAQDRLNGMRYEREAA